MTWTKQRVATYAYLWIRVSWPPWRTLPLPQHPLCEVNYITLIVNADKWWRLLMRNFSQVIESSMYILIDRFVFNIYCDYFIITAGCCCCCCCYLVLVFYFWRFKLIIHADARWIACQSLRAVSWGGSQGTAVIFGKDNNEMSAYFSKFRGSLFKCKGRFIPFISFTPFPHPFRENMALQ